MALGIRVELSIPADGPLGPALLAECRARQKAENKLAKSEQRDPRTITIKEVILSICSESLAVEFIAPKRGRRWPAKTQ